MSTNRTRTDRLGFILGCIFAAASLGSLAELYLRIAPPTDHLEYLGEASPLAGPFVEDPDFAVAYRSWEVFTDVNADALRTFGPLTPESDDRRVWAFFGNSFVQAPGMLADHVSAAVHDRRVFRLGRNEDLLVRLAQIKLLLGHGLRPERIFVALMPLDVAMLGRQPLETLRVTARGALTYEPRLPEGLPGFLVRQTRLGLTAWFRAGRQHGDPGFRPSSLNDGIDVPLLRDLTVVFAHLARIAGDHRVPVTVILIPNYEQVMNGAPCGFQDALAPVLHQEGFVVLDPRDRFREYPDRPALFLPDKHFTPAGNQILLAEILDRTNS